ncbi:MAG: hypothetical protein UT32_C0021G0014 [Parcubacteria group bacterium GW2011_GWC2_39_14]|nr:MAG: hypothetical protein UT32_C0021G0014 [Parcubacteria group bacterium GW2011_GWC2_39_14]KKR53947.1 MAG: hypothetical protein UT91_C0022G0014 [Parcubacteria group bacterium GW2011_GWA2_40_23]
MIERAGFVVNTRARGGHEGAMPIQKEIERRGWTDTRVFDCVQDSVSKMSDGLVALIVEKKIQVIFAYGGDGTIHKIVDILIYEFGRGRIPYIPPIVPVGGGTQKAIFQWLGWGQGTFFAESPLKIFRKCMSVELDHLPIRKMRLLAITFHSAKKQRVETHYGFIFIVGAVTRVIQLYDEGGKSILAGLKHIGLGMSASLLGVPTSHKAVIGQFHANQWADDVLLPRQDPLAVMCSVPRSSLFGIEPFLGVAESNQFYAASYAIPASILSALVPSLWRATWVPPGDRFFNRPVFSFKVQPENERLIFIDGDLYEITPGEMISVGLGPEISLVSYF